MSTIPRKVFIQVESTSEQQVNSQRDCSFKFRIFRLERTIDVVDDNNN